MHDQAVMLLQGHGVLPPLIAFIVAGGLVFFVASRLAGHADAIADSTGLGRLWVGTLLLGASTSLPELITDINAAALNAIDIGIGDLLGSTLTNMLLLALLDLGYRRQGLLENASPNHALVATLAIVLTAMAGAAIATGGWGRIGHVGIETMIIAGVYLQGMRTVFVMTTPTAPPEQLALGDSSRAVFRRAVMGTILAAIGLLMVAPLLVVSAEVLAVETGWSTTFVGTLLVGFTTSFPEIAASIAAVRIGAVDLAVGNVFGSNAFNMVILLFMDAFYERGPVLAHASVDHVGTSAFAIVALGFGLLGIFARRGQPVSRLRLESVALVCTYLGAMALLAR